MFITKFALVFAVVFVADICWTLCVLGIQKRAKFKAATFSGSIVLLSSVSLINQVDDHRLIFPAVLAATIGTFVTMWWDERNSKTL